jgi:hypothetical protein
VTPAPRGVPGPDEHERHRIDREQRIRHGIDSNGWMAIRCMFPTTIAADKELARNRGNSCQPRHETGKQTLGYDLTAIDCS